MPNDNVIKLSLPGAFDDQLTEVLRNGARALLAKAVEAEVAVFLDKHADLKTEDGRSRIVRHGHLPEREEIWPRPRSSTRNLWRSTRSWAARKGWRANTVTSASSIKRVAI